jgi:hypothetical protein
MQMDHRVMPGSSIGFSGVRAASASLNPHEPGDLSPQAPEADGNYRIDNQE